MAFVADFKIRNFNFKNKFDIENKTSTNHENGNDANRLLAAAIISAVLKEEVEEFWHIVKQQTYSDGEMGYPYQTIKKESMVKELIQIAAVAQQIAEELQANEIKHV